MLKFRKNDILSFIIGVDEDINLPGFGVDEDINLPGFGVDEDINLPEFGVDGDINFPGFGVDGDINFPEDLYFQATFTSFVSGLVCFLQVKKQQTKDMISKKRV